MNQQIDNQYKIQQRLIFVFIQFLLLSNCQVYFFIIKFYLFQIKLHLNIFDFNNIQWLFFTIKHKKYSCFKNKSQNRRQGTQKISQNLQLFKEINQQKFQKQIINYTSQANTIISQMNDYSWQQDNKSNSKKKIRQSQNYDDDFQEQNTKYKKQNKSIDLPRINNSPKNSPKLKSKLSKKQEDDEMYENDFQQPSDKKIGQNQKSKANNDNVDKKNKNKKSLSSSNVKRLVNNQQVLNKKPSASLLKNNSAQIQSKYLYYLKTQFPHTKDEIVNFQAQKINRLNEKLRSYIRKVNDQLNDLINENMRKLKAGTLQLKQQEKPVQDIIKVLVQQKKNGQTYIQTMQKQCYNLTEQWSKLKNIQNQQTTDQHIQQITQKIKDNTKQIGYLKYNMHQQGNKLTEEKNFSQKINDLKNKLLIVRKDDEKNTQKLQKCEKNYGDLSSKNPQIDIQLDRLLQQAKRQNITLNFNVLDKKKQQKIQEFKKKLQNIKSHKDKTQSLNDTKTSIIKKDIQTLNAEIVEIQKRFSQIEKQLHSAQQSSINLIEESKSMELEPYIQTHLDFIYKNIKEGNPLTTFHIKPSRSSKQKYIGQQPGTTGLKKSNSAANHNGFVRSQSEAELKPSFHITKKSPLQIKAKQKIALKLTEKTSQQRVWKDEVKNAAENQKNKQVDQSNNSKPFVIRRSQNLSPVSTQSLKTLKQTAQISHNKNEQKQNQKSSALGPKMKFKKAQNSQKDQIGKKQIFITEKNTNQLKTNLQPQSDHSKPHFKIKKAQKQRIQIQEEDLYLFPPGTIKNIKGAGSQKQPVKVISPKQQINKPEKQQSTSLKGHSFKLTKNNESKQIKLTIQQNKQEKKMINLQLGVKKPQQNSKKQVKPKEQDTGINVGDKRQVQRKIQRKNQETYAI